MIILLIPLKYTSLLIAAISKKIVTIIVLGNHIYEGGEIVNDFDAIYQQYGKTVYCFLLSLSRDESLAEELTQETMFRAIMNINSFRGDSKPSVWLCQIGKNLYFEWLKKSKRTIPIDDSLATYDSGYDIAEAFADKDIANQILKYLHKLEEPYTEVFMLHALGDIPLTRISQLFGKSDSWARVTYYRATAIITSKLKEGEK